MQASKTSDAYGLRLRFARFKDTPAPAAKPAALSELPTKPENELSYSYYAVVAILLIGIAIMLWLKRSIARGGTLKSAKAGVPGRASSSAEVSVRFEKNLDAANRVVMLDYEDESYLVLVGSSNVLLDKFGTHAPLSQNEFDEMLKSKHQELDSFLQIRGEGEALRSYKEKASGIDFDDIDTQPR